MARGIRLRIAERDHLVQLYQESLTPGPLQSEVRAWAPVEPREWCGFLPGFLTDRNYGAGEVPSGRRKVQFRAPSAIRDRMGFEVIRGPEGVDYPRWRVVSIDRNRRVVEAEVEPYEGSFDE